MHFMDLLQTHTYVDLEVTPSTWLEIYSKLEAAGYEHCFTTEEGVRRIHLPGIALVLPKPSPDEYAATIRNFLS